MSDARTPLPLPLPSPLPSPADEAAPTAIYDPGQRAARRRPATLPAPAAPPPISATTPPAGVPKVAPYPDRADRAERSEPIRVISMKEHSEPIRRLDDRAPRQVQLRAIAEVAKTPRPNQQLGRLAPPRDGRAVRARQLRSNVLWVIGGLVLAAAIALAIWLVAGR